MTAPIINLNGILAQQTEEVSTTLLNKSKEL